MRTVLLPLTLAALAASPALALPLLLPLPALPAGGPTLALPDSAAANGDFEQGHAGWTVPLATSPISFPVPGGDAHGRVLSVPGIAPSGASNGNWAYQRIPASNDLPYLAFQERAYVVRDATRPGIQVTGAVSNWYANGYCLPGGCRFTASLAISQDHVYASALGGSGVAVPFNTTDAWHTYTIVFAALPVATPAVPQVGLPSAGGVGVLLIDDVPHAVLLGTAGLASPAEYVYAGDAAQAAGRAPDVLWDDLYYGAAATLPRVP